MNKRVAIDREPASRLNVWEVKGGREQVCVEEKHQRIFRGCDVVHARTMMHVGMRGAA